LLFFHGRRVVTKNAFIVEDVTGYYDINALDSLEFSFHAAKSRLADVINIMLGQLEPSVIASSIQLGPDTEPLRGEARQYPNLSQTRLSSCINLDNRLSVSHLNLDY
jgi:hypothetical protein